jgi:transmembrane sensor
MNKENEHIDYDKIAAFLAGELNLVEQEQMEAWLAASDINQKVFSQCKNIFEAGSVAEDINRSGRTFDTQKAWDSVSQQIHEQNSGSLTNLEVVNNTYTLGFWLRLAAVLVIALATTIYLFNYSNPVVKYASNDRILEVILPDSSKVVLHKNSQIILSSNFGEDTRQVHLSGQAYFDVVRDEQKPFLIDTQTGIVEVLGTAFEIYEHKESLQVTVERGSVKLTALEDKNMHVVLGKNETAELIASRVIEVKKLTSLNHLYWANNTLTFRQAPLADVLNELGSIFNRQFEFDALQVQDCRLSAIFMNERFDDIIENISLSLDFEYSIQGDVIIIKSDGCL